MKRSVKKGDKGENIVSDILLSIEDEQYLINNLILLGDNDVSHQFDHILIRHNGVFVIETKNYYGFINGDNESTKWTKTYKGKGKEVTTTFMNPIKQNKAHIRFLKKVLSKDIPFINIVTFIDNDVSHLGIYTVINQNQLKERILNWEIDRLLTSQEMASINKTLLYLEADMQSDEHVKNIKSMKRDKYYNKH